MINKTSDADPHDQLINIARALYDLCFLALEIFCATTIRVYEEEIINEPRNYKKKARPIKTVLSEKLTTASFANLFELTKSCFHIIEGCA